MDRAPEKSGTEGEPDGTWQDAEGGSVMGVADGRAWVGSTTDGDGAVAVRMAGEGVSTRATGPSVNRQASARMPRERHASRCIVAEV